jgi:hypothetical protein
MAHRITSLVLDEPVLSYEIIRRWIENGSSFFPRIRRCTVFVHLIGNVLSELIHLAHQSKSTLRRLVIFFDGPAMYHYVVKQIVEHGVSLHTMQLIIVKGNRKSLFLSVDNVFRLFSNHSKSFKHKHSIV